MINYSVKSLKNLEDLVTKTSKIPDLLVNQVKLLRTLFI
jgi:hypothetical protein